MDCRTSALPATLLLSLCLAACGGKKKETETAANVEVDNEDEFDDGMEMMQEFGGMNQEKVDKIFRRIAPDLSACLTSVGKNQDYLFGDVAFLFKVNLQGVAEIAQVKSSNLGSFRAERCMLGVIKKTTWPKPVGGYIGLVNYGPMGYVAPDDIRPPVEWAASDVEKTLTDAKNAEELYACGRGGPFEITAYIEGNGRVLSAGVAHTDDNGEETAACLVDVIEGMTFDSPGSWKAKVTFTR